MDKNKSAKDKASTPPQKPQRWIVYVGISAIVLLFLSLSIQGGRKSSGKQAKKSGGQIELASVGKAAPNSVTRHLQDSEIQRELMMRSRALDNLPFQKAVASETNDFLIMPAEQRTFGLQLDSDDTSERVFEDLYGEPRHGGDFLPSDKINARIANRKLVSEMERAEKIAYISDFIRTAYDRGYEVEIDANLVVVGVKKINRAKVLDINQVIDRLAKGQQPGSGS